jgi:hypothetical protein
MKNVTPPRFGDAATMKLPHGAEISATGLLLPPDLDADQWEAIGNKLVAINSRLQWAIGDWWVHGDNAGYGERKASGIAETIGCTLERVRDLGWVARNVTSSFRNDALSFTHHTVVASLKPEDQKTWLSKAADGDWSVPKLRTEIKNSRGSSKSIAASREHLEDVEPREEQKRETERKLAGIFRSIKQCYPPADALPDDLSEADIDELIDACSPLSEAWADFRNKLESFRKERHTKNPTALH